MRPSTPCRRPRLSLLLCTAAELATFEREAALLARLHHRNVVQVREGGGGRQGGRREGPGAVSVTHPLLLLLPASLT